MISRLTSARVYTLAAGMVVLAMAALFLAGCGSGGGGSQLVVYTAEKDEIVRTVTELWAKRHPDIKLSVVAAGTNEIVQRLRAERQRPLGDVVWGVGAEGLSVNPELFTPYTTAETKAVDPRWLAVAKGEPWQPNNVVPMVLLYNTKLVPASKAPKSWRDLTDPRWKGKLAYAAPDKSGSAYTQLATMLAVFGGDTPAAWKQVARVMGNSIILQSSSKVPKGVSDGEYEVGITYENVAGLYQTGGAPVKIVYPSDGTSITPDANALIKGAPHPREAKMFLDFLQSRDVQARLSEKLILRTCRTDVPPPPGLPPVDDIVPAPGYEYHWGVDHWKDFVAKWQDLMLRLQQ